METIGNDYNIPVFNTVSFMQNYAYNNVQSDSIHYNGLGYTVLASKIAGILAGITHIYNPLKIKNNDNIIINVEDYGFTQNGTIIFNEVGDSPFGIGATSDKGLYCNMPMNSSLTINFKAEDENLMLIPLYRTATEIAGIKIDVDCGVNQGQFVSSYYQNTYPRTSISGVPTTTFSVINKSTSRMDITQETPTSLANGSLYLANKGYYSVTITNVGQDDKVYFYGFLVKNANDVRKARNKILSKTHATTAEALTFTTPITTNQVNPYLLYDAGTDFSNYWKLHPIKLIVHSYTKSTYEYMISVGASSSNHDWTFQEVGKALYGTDRTHDRVVTSISYDGNILTITWGGDINYPSEFSLALA